ncbi:MAG: hypothetical protein MUO68_10565 [Desulfobacteraceae bacterium]|nr:hypothetical protein [Desulfobacteraceae bacterium]
MEINRRLHYDYISGKGNEVSMWYFTNLQIWEGIMRKGFLVIAVMLFVAFSLSLRAEADSTGVKEGVAEATRDVKTGVQDAGSGIKQGGKEVGTAFKEGSQEVGRDVKDGAVAVGRGTEKIIKDIGEGAKQGYKDVSDGVKEGLKDGGK